MKKDLTNLYFEWMSNLVYPDRRERLNYTSLLGALNNTVFDFSIPLDENRYVDGLALRKRFAQDNDISNDVVMATFSHFKCSMLEMLVALSIRIEEHIMSDPYSGDRTSVWFDEMIDNLKLKGQFNQNFDRTYFDRRIDILLNHEYDYNGRGGLFTVLEPRRDMRRTEIWYQMSWYIDAILKN